MLSHIRARLLPRRQRRTGPATGHEVQSVELFEPVGFKDVLFVFDLTSASARYRCEHQAEQLRFLGVSADVVQSGRIDLVAAVDHYGCFVLHRVQWTDGVAAFFERAGAVDKVVIFDVDDLVFEPGLNRYWAFLESWPEKNRRVQLAEFDRYRQTLEACGCATVSTEPLRGHVEKRNERVGVVFNSVSDEMVRLADEVLTRPRKARGYICIAYFSGTRTHNRDFLEAADAVVWALDAYPRTRFLAVGKLDLDERFGAFGRRVRKIPSQPWQALPGLLYETDINLAPLEPENPVTECKSCVKYLEAGLVGVPTVATPTADFLRATRRGRTALLAPGPAEWRTALRKLIESAELRGEIGGLARKDVRENHTTRARAGLLGKTLADLGVSVSGE